MTNFARWRQDSRKTFSNSLKELCIYFTPEYCQMSWFSEKSKFQEITRTCQSQTDSKCTFYRTCYVFSHIFPEVFLDSITWKVLACAPLKSGEFDQCHFIEHFFSLYELEGLPIYLYGWRISLGYQRDYRQLLKLKTVSAAQLIDNTLFSPHVQTKHTVLQDTLD